MTKINLLKYTLIGALPTALILSATLTPPIFLNNQFKNSQTQNYTKFSTRADTEIAPTKLILRPHYPNGITVSAFRYEQTSANISGQDTLRAFFSNFLDGMETIPPSARLTYLNNESSADGIKMTLTLSEYYDDQSNLVVAKQNTQFDFKLIPDDQAATITTSVNWKNDATFTNAIDFYNEISPDGILNRTLLYNYLVIEWVPPSAAISIANEDPEFNNSMFIRLDVVLTHWWDKGTLKPKTGDAEQTHTYSLEKNFSVDNTSNDLSFQWWWIVLPIGVVIVFILMTFLIIKYYKLHKQKIQNRKFKDAALDA